jgi:hypothetical protein
MSELKSSVVFAGEEGFSEPVARIRIAALELEVANLKADLADWNKKTAWVQAAIEAGDIDATAGEHRADVIARLIQRPACESCGGRVHLTGDCRWQPGLA